MAERSAIAWTDATCHVDALLEFANAPICEAIL
jgi:hypothetical protein